MKIYIAGPMRGIPQFNFPAFNTAAAELRANGHEVFNPAERDTETHGEEMSTTNETGCVEQAAKEHGFNMREALAHDAQWICLNADAIFMLRGWEKSKGATAEKALAEALGLEVILWQLT